MYSCVFTGPANWKDMPGNAACGGQKQSPIDIVTSGANFLDSMGNLVYSGYDQNPTSMKLKNNGHTGWLLVCLCSIV